MAQAMHHYGQPLEVLFYEVLDMPLREYEQLKHMKARSCPAPPVGPLHTAATTHVSSECAELPTQRWSCLSCMG